jgi:LysM repeat protein
VIRNLTILLGVAALAACASVPGKPEHGAASTMTQPEAAAPAKDASVREHIAYAIERLGSGDIEEGKSAVQAALAKSPAQPTALRLLEQIETDPVVLLGEANAPYVVVAGDTMSALAHRYLGDPMLFLALSKYNGLSAPNALEEGRTLRIPVRASTADPAAKPSDIAALPLMRPSPDAGKANAVRLQGLERLNAGEAARAVALLTEAQALDPANAAIAKDLERARRIQSALEKE